MVAKTRKARKGPSESAANFPEGTIKRGNDKQSWVIKKVTGGSQRWMPYSSAELFGYKPLTVDYLAKHIGSTITVYEREYMDTWPKKSSDFDVKYSFLASGDGELIKGKNTKVFPNWLKHKIPEIKVNNLFFIKGIFQSIDDIQNIQAGPSGLVSSNLMNTEAFVKA